MSNKSNDLLAEELKYQFDQAVLVGDLADANRVIDAMKDAGLPYRSFVEELFIEKAHKEDPVWSL